MIRGKNMRFSHVSLIAVLLIVIAVALAGCSGSSPAATPATTSGPSATTASGTSPASSAAHSAGSFVTGAGIFGSGASYNWFEYVTTMQGMTSIMRFEKSGKCTITMKGNDLPGGSMTMDCSGKTTTAQSNPADVDPDTQYMFVGIEPVSVPAGTYPTASKYSVTSEGHTSYYWTAPGVPTFVKYEINTDDGKLVTELNGWG